MSNIIGVDVPQDSSGYGQSYQTKISNSLSAIDTHDHDVGSGLEVKRIAASATDDSTITSTSGVLSLKDAGINETHVDTSVAGTIPSGAIISYLDKDDGSPGAEWLKCDGSQVSRTTYATLYAVIGDKFGNGNGTTTFHLPALAGQFLRGADLGVGRDPDAASRTASGTGGATGNNIGTLQKGALKNHVHSISPDPASRWSLNSGANNGSAGGSHGWGNQTVTYNINASGGNEFRPINMAVQWWIKT